AAIQPFDLLQLLHGTGDGRFTYGPQLSVPRVRDQAIASGDFNGDGRPDLAVSGHGFPLIVFLATGPMQFGPGVPYHATLAGTTDTLVGADLDQDGRQDLLTVDDSVNGLVILRGDGLGRFPMESSLLFPSTVPDFGAADFDGDGLPDLAVLQSDGPPITSCS